MQPNPNTPDSQAQIDARTNVLLAENQKANWTQIDHLFAVLLTLQWLACIALAIWLSPRAWEGLNSYVHPHIWAAVFLGGLIAAGPIVLIVLRPGEAITRYVVAVAQMMHSALLIHLSGGRIEMHFHVFGSLAFLSMYRQWKVLIPATIVVALDHVLRGIFWPQSVFGVASVSYWRWLEHSGWVIFEDSILIWSCIWATRGMATSCQRQAQLEAANDRVEAEVARQTARLEFVSHELIGSARRAGMAEIATGVLHNVGNVLNSVNVSASFALEKLKDSEIPSLVKVGEMLRKNEGNLPAFLTSDERGKHLPEFLIELTDCLGRERDGILGELQSVASGLDHIKQIVSTQQRHAKSGSAREKLSPAEVFELAIAMDLGESAQENLTLERDFPPIEPMAIDKHRVLQILINLLSNAKKAVMATGRADQRITLSTRRMDRDGNKFIRFEVKDNGVGIKPEDLTRIFAHGFTTRNDGHGFGLHSAANAASELGGKVSAASDGPGLGATFALELPMGLSSVEELLNSEKEVQCQRN